MDYHFEPTPILIEEAIVVTAGAVTIQVGEETCDTRLAQHLRPLCFAIVTEYLRERRHHRSGSFTLFSHNSR